MTQTHHRPFAKQPLLIERLLVFVMAVAVFTWKPGMYIVPGALFLYFVVRVIRDAQYRADWLQSRISIFSLLLFVLGLICVWISVGNVKEVLWVARKGLCLLMVPPLVLAFRHQANRISAFWGLMIGLWANVVVVVVQSLALPLGQVLAGRIEGIWYLGPWDALLGLFIAFLLPKLTESTPQIPRMLVHITFAAAIVLLLLSGGRAPWVATALIMGAYLVLFHRKVLVYLTLTIVVVGLAAVQFFPTQVQPKLERITSIVNTEDSGNWVRLHLWSLGVDHLKFYAQHEPLKLIAGAGPSTYHAEQKSFFTQQDYPADVRARLILYGYPTGDTHNMYLDAALRMGVVWTALFLVFMFALAYVPSGPSVRQRIAPLLLLGSYLIVGMFYTTVLSFVTFFIVFFLTLSVAQAKKT